MYFFTVLSYKSIIFIIHILNVRQIKKLPNVLLKTFSSSIFNLIFALGIGYSMILPSALTAHDFQIRQPHHVQ